MFFGRFDKIQYDGKTVTDITNALLLKYRPMNNTTLYTYHTVKDGETPESIAYDYYGNASDHWVILLLNNIVNPWFDWALTSEQLTSMVESKYGAGNSGKIHHLVKLPDKLIVDQHETRKYVDNDGRLIQPLPHNYSIVTNLEYEVEKNDERRYIKILAPRYLQEFKNQFEDIMNREGLE